MIMTPQFFKRIGWTAALAAVALLGSCGGGSQVRHFSPARMVSFGDEFSAIDSDGSTSTVNYYVSPSYVAPATPTVPATGGSYDCTYNPIWVQSLAASFGMNFPACNPTGATAADMQAQAGDTTQIVVNKMATYHFKDGDLVTVLAGANDIKASYDKIAASTSDLRTESNNLKALGIQLGQEVHQIVSSADLRVLVLLVPDLGLSPWAVAQGGGYDTNTTSLTCDKQTGDTPQHKISTLTDCFNTGVRLGLAKDTGYTVGLVDTDSLIRALSINNNSPNSPGSDGGFLDTRDPACAVSDKRCAVVVATAGGTAAAANMTGNDINRINTYLWSYDRWLTPAGHAQMAAQARNVFNTNPF